MLNWIYYCRVINILMALDNRWSFYFVFRHRKSPVLIRVTGHWSRVERSLCAAAARGHIGGEEENVAHRGGVLLGQRRVASIQRGAFRILFNERTDLKEKWRDCIEAGDRSSSEVFLLGCIGEEGRFSDQTPPSGMRGRCEWRWRKVIQKEEWYPLWFYSLP